MIINIRVNGKDKEIDTDNVDNLKQLVTTLVQQEKGLIAEVNEKIVHRDLWAQHPVRPGDVIELINFVGGG